MKKTITIAAMAALLPVTMVWAGGQHDGMSHNMGDHTHGAMSNTTVQKHGHRLDEGGGQVKHEKMTHKMSDKERGPMDSVDAYKKSSNRLQGKRQAMEHQMDGNRHGAMDSTAPHAHGHRVD